MMVRDADMDINAHAGAERCPAVVTAATAPAYPCRPPFVTGHPSPTVIIGIRPAAVMEGRPSPGIVGYPSVSIAGHHPIAVGSIGLEAWLRIRKPDISVFRVVYPLTVRCQFVVK